MRALSWNWAALMAFFASFWVAPPAGAGGLLDLFQIYQPNIPSADMIFYVPKYHRHSPDGRRPFALIDGPEGLKEIPAVDDKAYRAEKGMTVRFARPLIHGARLDWCMDRQQGCGPVAAQYFCASKGFTRVIQAVEERQVGRYAETRQLGSGLACAGNACTGFQAITCTKG